MCCYALECFVILLVASPCLSWDPPLEDDPGCIALFCRGSTHSHCIRTIRWLYISSHMAFGFERFKLTKAVLVMSGLGTFQ